ncbi:MAG: hypothetical protein LBT44_01925, partial [Clostridiales bacterium]|nr:hypothetical protein [Clostridiales bacterium]
MKLFNRHWLKAVAAVAITAQIFTVFPAIKASEIESGAKQDSQAEENTNEALTELKTDDTDEDLTLLSTDDTDEDLTLLSTDNTDEDLTLLNTDNTDEDLTLLSTDNTDEDLILLNTDEQKISESEKSPVDFDDLKKVQPGQEAKVEVKLSYLKGGRPVTDTNISYPDYGNPDGQINFSVRINYKVTIYDFDGRYEPGSVEIRIPRVFGAAPTVGGEEFETAGYEGPGDETVLFKNRGILEQGDAGFFDVTYSFKPREIPKTDGGGLLIQNDIKAAVTAYYSGGAIYNAETSALNVEVQTLKDEVYLLKSVSPPNQTAFTSTQFYSWLKDKNSGDYWFVTFNMDLNFMAKTNM